MATKITNSHAKWQLTPFVDVNYGSESNIYKSPDKVGDSTGLVKSDSFYLYDVGVRLKKKYRLNNKLRFDYRYYGKDYLSNSNLHKHKHQTVLQYRHKFKKNYELKIDTSWEAKKSTGSDVIGDTATRDYSYSRYSLGPELIYSFGKTSEIFAGYNWRYKDYEETESFESLDYSQNEIVLGTVLDDRRRKLNFRASMWLREYREKLARDKDGNRVKSDPKRKQNYYIASVGYDHKFGSKKQLEAGIEYRYRIRDDSYENYYSYTENKLKADLKVPITRSTKIEVGVNGKQQNYLVQEAASSSGTNPKLVKVYQNQSISIIQKICSNTELYLQYELNKRDTNVTDENEKTNRDYEDTILIAGIKAKF